MSQRSAQKAESRRAILEAAARLVREGGMAGASVQQVMAGAGLTVGAFYAHFEDKDELFAQAFALALEDAKTLVAEAAAGTSGLDAANAVVARYLSEEHRDDVRHGCPLPATLGEAAAGSGTSTRKLLAGGLETMRARVAEAAQDEIGVEQALALVALMVGGQILARAVRGTPMSSRLLEACRHAGEVLVRGPKRDGQRSGKAAK